MNKSKPILNGVESSLSRNCKGAIVVLFSIVFLGCSLLIGRENSVRIQSALTLFKSKSYLLSKKETRELILADINGLRNGESHQRSYRKKAKA